MKALVLSLLLAVSTQAMGAVELGKYRAIDKDTKSITADLNLKADGTATIVINSADLPKPVPCEGKYKVEAKMLTADVKCKSEILAEAKVQIDITNVTPDSVRSPNGAEVDVIIDALGDDALKFLLKKAD
ncbi:hypothetical protein K2P97_04285 [bacterium]|nr:hypothetical protein [bacterium]